MRGIGVEGTPTIQNDSASQSSLGFSARAGDVLEVAIELPAGSLPVGEVHVVGRDAIDSIELFSQAWYVVDNDELHYVGAVAVVRDAEGVVLREAPLQWSAIACASSSPWRFHPARKSQLCGAATTPGSSRTRCFQPSS
jgi:hypothetical protein